ncbi:MAG TPA: DUF3108 domain-containing protein [Puia sp.]|nr:DUF3108 domain-containing protein [Puia sp.]
MRVLSTLCILLLALAVLSMARGDNRHGELKKVAAEPDSAKSEFCGNIRNTAFGSGEHLTYRISYVLAGVSLNGGVATFNTSLEKFEGKNVYHVVAEGKSTHDLFYRVRDKYETYIDTSTLQPYKFIRDVSEGGYKTFENVSFHKTTNTAITNSGIYAVPSCVQDVVSAVFYARNIDFSKYKANDKIPFDMFLDRQVYHLYIRYLGRATIKTKYGRFRTFKFKPLLVKGNMFEGGEKMTVWVSDDPNHIAIRIESPLSVGKVNVDMSGCENLRYPLSSEIAGR